MRTVMLRIAALALLLLLVLVGVLTTRSLSRLPDTIIYFVGSDGNVMQLEPVNRRFRAPNLEAQLNQALEALIAGPTPQEEARGLSNTIPAGTRVLGLSQDGDLVTVNLSSAFEEGGGTAMMFGRLYQLFFTVTQPRGVDRAALYIEGRRLEVFGGEGILVSHPWTRPEALPRW